MQYRITTWFHEELFDEAHPRGRWWKTTWEGEAPNKESAIEGAERGTFERNYKGDFFKPSECIEI